MNCGGLAFLFSFAIVSCLGFSAASHENERMRYYFPDPENGQLDTYIKGTSLRPSQKPIMLKPWTGGSLTVPPVIVKTTISPSTLPYCTVKPTTLPICITTPGPCITTAPPEPNTTIPPICFYAPLPTTTTTIAPCHLASGVCIELPPPCTEVPPPIHPITPTAIPLPEPCVPVRPLTCGGDTTTRSPQGCTRPETPPPQQPCTKPATTRSPQECTRPEIPRPPQGCTIPVTTPVPIPIPPCPTIPPPVVCPTQLPINITTTTRSTTTRRTTTTHRTTTHRTTTHRTTLRTTTEGFEPTYMPFRPLDNGGMIRTAPLPIFNESGNIKGEESKNGFTKLFNNLIENLRDSKHSGSSKGM